MRVLRGHLTAPMRAKFADGAFATSERGRGVTATLCRTDRATHVATCCTCSRGHRCLSSWIPPGVELINVVAELVAKGQLEALVNELHKFRGSEDDTLLGWAIQWGEVETMRTLVNAGADVHALDSYHMSPLHRAATRMDALRFLIEECGVSANERCEFDDGEPAIVMALRNNCSRCFEYLLDNGADIDTCIDGKNLVQLCFSNGHGDGDDDDGQHMPLNAATAQVLARRARHLFDDHLTWELAFQMAMDDDDTAADVLNELVISHGFDVNCTKSARMPCGNTNDFKHRQWTALELACGYGCARNAKLLLERGSIVNTSSPLVLLCEIVYSPFSTLETVQNAVDAGFGVNVAHPDVGDFPSPLEHLRHTFLDC
jgi:hypothetical protein